MSDTRVAVANTERFQLGNNSLRRLLFVERQLRMLMQPAAQHQQTVPERLIDNSDDSVYMFIDDIVHAYGVTQPKRCANQSNYV